MRRTLACVIFCLLSSICLYGIDISINGISWQRLDADSLATLVYSVDPDHPSVQGVTLDELLPPMIDAYYLTAGTASGPVTWRNNDLAEMFPLGYLVPSSDACTLILDGRKAEGVRSIDVRGEVIEDRTMEIWVSWEGVSLLKEEIARYSRLHNADIKVVEVPKTSSKLISVLRGGGTPPDALMIQSDYLPELTGSGALQNLDYIDTGRFDSRSLDAFILQDKLWGIPFYCDPQVVFVNRSVMPDIPSFDWTLSDLERLSAALKDRGIIPLSWNAYSANWLIPFQMGFGKDRLIEQDGSIIINDDSSIDALEYVLSLQDRGYLDVLERDAMISLFVSGKVAMILSGSYSIPGFEELGLDFAVVPYPVNEETGLPVAPLLDYKAFSITRRSRHPVMARRLVQYLTGTGVQQRFPAALSKLAAETSARSLSAALSDHYLALTESSLRGVPIPPDKAFGVYKNTMWSLLRFSFTGRMTAEEVMNQAQELIKAKLSP